MYIHHCHACILRHYRRTINIYLETLCPLSQVETQLLTHTSARTLATPYPQRYTISLEVWNTRLGSLRSWLVA